MQFFFAITLFLSAALLFLVQPMFAKMVLPLLGGTPAVWNTCMVFYQAALLAGYVYAHVTTRLLGPRRQAALHMVILCLPWLTLPIVVAESWTPPAEANPLPWLLTLLVASVGLPFFVVSASAPMLQAWFANTSHAAAKDPYFLYAASNLGSMVALLGYPVLMEPSLPLAQQRLVWAAGYGLLMLLTVGCAVLLWRSPSKPGTRGEGLGVRGEGARTTGLAPRLWPLVPRPSSLAPNPSSLAPGLPTWAQRLRWLVLAFAPSSLLLGVTTHISTDIAAVPLLWVVPLALYLLTFTLVFARRTLLRHAWMLRLQPYLIVLLAALFFQSAAKTISVLLPLHLVTFFVTAMVCHGELARMRPKASRLTEFYIWMSVGGVLGGLFNALVAPNLFATILEYPLVIVVASMLRPAADPAQTTRARWLDLALPATTAVGFGGLLLALQAAGVELTVAAVSAILAPVALVAFGFQKRPVRFGLGVATVLIVGLLCREKDAGLLHVERNFFGVIRVRYNRSLNTNVLVHGSTNHGMQSLEAGRRNQPLCYYHRTGPLGDVFRAVSEPKSSREIGVIGLGTGSIAAYGRPGQRITFYEIDPAVERVARDIRYFTFLRDGRAEVDVVLGDARLSLAKAPDAYYDLLILDAFSSDAIPVHLITREAIRLYFRKLADNGLLALHISNRYLDLGPVLGNLAADAGVVCRIRRDLRLSQAERNQGKLGSCWVVMARRPDSLGTLVDDPNWQPLPGPGIRWDMHMPQRWQDAPLWSDDFSNIIAVMKWR